MKTLLLNCAIAIFLSGSVMAQAPPVIVQPANQTAPVSRPVTQATANEDNARATMKSLEEMKAANEEMLKKQQTVLEALDQLQKEADQLRIYAKRG
jgi:phosphopantothenoylcysteine synthetase/decarboxylase